ncbi:MAG: hypothetical protein IPF68_14915 [Bacteroidales bacterium]|nr:hypothetical protein [Bacteroidales bacterium]
MINNFMNPNMMALLGAAQGLLQSSGASPRQITMGEALGNGLQGGMQGMQQGMDMQMRGQHMDAIKNEAQMKQNKLLRDMEIQEYLRKNVGGGDSNDPVDLGKKLISSGYQELIPMGTQLLKSKTAKSFIKGLDDKGQPTFYTGYSTGEVAPTGVTPAEKLMQINRGSQIDLANPYTGQAQTSLGVGMSPGQAASLSQAERHFGQSQGLAQQKFALDQLRTAMEMDPKYQASKAGMIAAGKESALNQVKSTQELPRVIQQGEQTIKLVDDLLNHPGFKMSVGKSAPIGSALSLVPGTDSASFDIALNQLKGKQFLEAFESLKGGGQITQIEGEKATQAMSRMEKANTEDEFIRASREFQSIIQQGIGRAKAKAGVSQQPMQGGGGGFKIERLD